MLEHILVIEDDEFMRMSLETELKLAGYRVSIAENGNQAVELARHQHFDLIVSDIRMPGMDGLETLSALRDLTPEARSIVITGYADPEAPITAVKLKVDDYLMKPFTAEDLLKSVRASLESQLEELRKRRSVQKLREVMLTALQQPGQSERTAAAHRVARLARALGLSAARSQSLQLAVWLLGLDEQIGAVEELKSLTPVLEQSLERFDGTGPKGLAGANIPLDARVLRAGLEPEAATGVCDPELTAVLASSDEGPAPAALETRPARTLLTVAQSYLDSGHLDVATEALAQLGQRLEKESDVETEVELWMLRSELAEHRGDRPGAVEAAARAGSLADRAGLDLRRAQAALRRARLEAGERSELERARATFALFESLPNQVEADFWLSALGVEAARPRLLGGLAQSSDLFTTQSARLAEMLPPDDPALLAAVRAAGDRALATLELWLSPQAAVKRQLKAVDLLAAIDTPAARELLARVGSEAGVAAAAKSRLLAQREGASELRLHLFGHFTLSVNGRPIDEDGLATRKTRNLLAYLASRFGHEIDEDVLIDVFWENAGPKARHSLHNAISQIRKALKPILGEGATIVSKRRQGYALDPHPQLWIDLQAFQQHLDEAQRHASGGRAAEAAAELKRAEGLYRGEFMEGNYEDWTESPRSRLSAHFTHILTALGRHFFDRGKHDVALDYWKRLLDRDNCSEDAYLGVMLCHIALGKQSDAVRTYHQCARVLREELGLAPPPRIVETYMKLLEGAPSRGGGG